HVIITGAIGRMIRLFRTQRNPAHRVRNRPIPNVSADEGYQRWSIHRVDISWAGNPSPAVRSLNPPAIVEGRETPRFGADPRPAPRLDVDPMAVAVRRPSPIDSGGTPHRSICIIVDPLAVLTQVFRPGHFGCDIGIGDGFGVLRQSVPADT